MNKEWFVKYDNVEIRVSNHWKRGEQLIVNDEIQDQKFSLISSELTGHFIDSKGERKNIKASIGGFFTIECHLFIDDKKMDLRVR